MTTLTIDDQVLALILQGLGMLPHGQVERLVADIRAEAVRQREEATAAPSGAATAE
jgi:hypothetical protein